MRPAHGVTWRALILLFLFLGGCTTLVQPQGKANRKAWRSRFQRLKQLNAWQLSGRIGVVARGGRGGAAGLSWQQSGDWISMSLSGPFGMGGVHLYGTPGAMVLVNSKGKRFYTSEPSAALETALGWPVPVSSLRYWVIGRPAPGQPYKLRLDAHGLVMQLVQQGWTVSYQLYMQVHGYWLPHRVTAVRAHGHVKLVISYWQIGGT